mgnify:CR=1 FL=1
MEEQNQFVEEVKQSNPQFKNNKVYIIYGSQYFIIVAELANWCFLGPLCPKVFLLVWKLSTVFCIMSLCAFQRMFQFMKFCVYWFEYNLGFAKGGRTFSVPEERLKWKPSPQIILPVSACKHSQWHEHSTMLLQKHLEATNAQNRVPNLFAPPFS